MDRELRYYDLDGVRVLSVKGEFDLSNSDSLESFIAIALDGSKPVVVDFGATTYVDSTVLTVLVRQKKRAGTKLRIVVPKGAKLRRIFDITGLRTGLGIEESVEAARLQMDDASSRPELLSSNGKHEQPPDDSP